MLEACKIIAICVLAAVTYGIAHDQVTARVCVEYFTIGHPPVFNTDSPTILAFGWGVIATWWVGVLLGILAALAARLGPWPTFDSRRLLRPIGCLLLVMAIASLVAGISGYVTAKLGGAELIGPLAGRIPVSKHSAFIADLWAHLAAYGVGFVGGIVVCGLVLLRRNKMAAERDSGAESKHGSR